MINHGEEASFATRWNPAAQTKNHLFVSHHLAYNEKERETIYYNCDEFIQSLDIGKEIHLNIDRSFVCLFCLALNAYRQEKNQGKLELKEEKILIPSYASVWSVLFNQNFLGFNRDRNGANW